MPKTTKKRHENVGLGNLSDHLGQLLPIVMIFFGRIGRIFENLHDGLRGCDRPRRPKWTHKAVNLLPCEQLKAWKVTALKKVVVKKKSSG